MYKIRIDQLLVQRGLCESRNKARIIITAGSVMVADQPITKPGTKIKDDVDISIMADSLPFVSRGGLKLDRALTVFNINPNGCTCLDAGASTGGFTDCLLQKNAALVYAVDVGVDQLHWKLRNNPRVVSIERTNIRNWDPSLILRPCKILVADLSFISLRLAIPPLITSLAQDAIAILLVKPQFEAGRDEIRSGGIVRNPLAHQRVKDELWSFFQATTLKPLAICDSPILGTRGNKEFLMYLRLNSN